MSRERPPESAPPFEPPAPPRRRWPGNDRVELYVGIAMGLLIIIVWAWTCRG